ncbi:MAG: D-2-hydroxyacid dehydrogenase [Rikenellaceae bacterium]
MQIVFLDEATLGKMAATEKIASLGEYIAYDFTSPEDVSKRVKDADVIITNKVYISKELMSSLKRLKLICVAATGMNNVDLKGAAELGIVVKNVAGYSTASVTQTTFALLLQLMSKVSCFDKYVKDGSYAASNSFTKIDPSYDELAGKVFGVVGLGTIGKSVAGVAKAFGAEVIYYSTSGANNNSDYRRVDMSELLSKSDVISIHAPLNENTNNLFDYKELSQMKPTSIIINMGRGGIINEAALARVIDEGKIGGAALDVFTKEPILNENPLSNIKNKERVAFTPHIAWASLQARERLMELLYQNIINWQKSI